jgi:hypothetical protein
MEWLGHVESLADAGAIENEFLIVTGIKPCVGVKLI